MKTCPHCKTEHKGRKASCEYCLAVNDAYGQPQSQAETQANEAHDEQLRYESQNQDGGWIE